MQKITLAGGNLYQLAAQYLGDATQWVRIAQLNGLSDPMLSGLNTLLIPDPNPAASGGVPAGYGSGTASASAAQGSGSGA
jgi:hypothetical protein